MSRLTQGGPPRLGDIVRSGTTYEYIVLDPEPDEDGVVLCCSLTGNPQRFFVRRLRVVRRASYRTVGE